MAHMDITIGLNPERYCVKITSSGSEYDEDKPSEAYGFYSDVMTKSVYDNTDGLEWKVWGSPHLYARKHSIAGSGGSGFTTLMDFTFRILITEYNPCADFINLNGEDNNLRQENISQFYVNDELIPFNVFDFRNYMWGGAMKILGFSKSDAQWWANSVYCGFRFTQTVDLIRLKSRFSYLCRRTSCTGGIVELGHAPIHSPPKQ